jgi:hypothetical protein
MKIANRKGNCKRTIWNKRVAGSVSPKMDNKIMLPDRTALKVIKAAIRDLIC